MKLRKTLCLALAAVMLIGTAGCGGDNGKIKLSVGNWPVKEAPEAREAMDQRRDEFMEQNPDIEIVPDTYAWDSKTFVMKASGNQLPNLMKMVVTEVQSCIKNGYAADITDALEENGYIDAINPMLMDFMKDENGRIYGLPISGYVQGLHINKKIFREAGLVNADGSVMVPDTWEEVAEFSKIIKEKTGKAGLVFPTSGNCGGWHFMNIAWAFGADFEKQREDGSWEAIFDTQETRDAMQYLYDLKWKYNALLDDSVIIQEDMVKYFGTYQAGMMIYAPPLSKLSHKYGMDKDDIYVTRIPAGPKGRFAQMGADLYMFSANSTKEQIDAGMKWLKFSGVSPELNEESINNIRKSNELTLSQGGFILGRDAVDVWVNPEQVEKRREISNEYTNVDIENYNDYFGFEGVEVKTEPAACCQQLYAVLDGVIQEIFTSENADIDALVTKACNDFQANHLDKMN